MNYKRQIETAFFLGGGGYNPKSEVGWLEIFCHGLPSILCEEISDSDQPEGNADDRN